jgi:hypothetical protein
MSRRSILSLIILLSFCLALLVLAVLLLLTQFTARQGKHPGRAYGIPSFTISSQGTDYYSPTDYWNHCGNWTWLTSCYTSVPSSGLSQQQQLASDAAWIAKNNMGQTQRVWVILDQGIIWDADGRYRGLDPTYLANLDDALAKFHQNGIRVVAVLLVYSKGSSDKNQFRTESLDGQHPQLRTGYMQALKDFAAHVAANSIDAATISLVDSCNECLYQLEMVGLSDQTIHGFMHDAYAALKSGNPSLPVTVSDTTRLLKDYATWWPVYSDSVDVVDEHAYSDHPWTDEGLWLKARLFKVPWIVGEAGCNPGNVSCTYRGDVTCTQPTTCALSVDAWWLQNLKRFGAKAVLIEERNTAWSYPKGPTSPMLTAVGRMMQQAANGSSMGLAPCRR